MALQGRNLCPQNSLQTSPQQAISSAIGILMLHCHHKQAGVGEFSTFGSVRMFRDELRQLASELGQGESVPLAPQRRHEGVVLCTITLFLALSHRLGPSPQR